MEKRLIDYLDGNQIITVWIDDDQLQELRDEGFVIIGQWINHGRYPID